MSTSSVMQTQTKVKRVFVDRSRVETYQRCHRLRYYEYHEAGLGITSAKKPLPLAVGGSVHEGLATLLECSMGIPLDELSFHLAELKAVQAALEDFAQYQAALDLGEEEFEIAPSGFALEAAKTLGTPDAMEQLKQATAKGRSEFDQYLYDEQRALVEGLVRAYARRRLRPLLEQYEVLEVEREGSWLLSQGGVTSCDKCGRIQAQDNVTACYLCGGDCSHKVLDELWFMSRPDALLLERESKQLYLLSFKTAAKWDRRKGEDAKRDMQGLSEGVEVEKRLGEEWRKIHDDGRTEVFLTDGPAPTNKATNDYLRTLPAPPRILGIRYEYMLKGERRLDKDLSSRIGLDVRAQTSPLVRAYKNPGMAAGDEQFNVSWEYVKEDGALSKLYYKNWKGAPVFESITIKDWINKLDSATMTLGEEGREMGYACQAQATGFLAEHPLDALFIPPIIVFRNDDELRDWIEQVEAQEREIAEHVAEVAAAKDEGEKRHLLNVHFQMHRRACEYPTTCQMVKICFGGEDIRRDPLGSKLYTIRTANHPQEVGS